MRRKKGCTYYWWRQNWLGEKVGQFCWDQHCEKGFVQRMLEGCFKSTEVYLEGNSIQPGGEKFRVSSLTKALVC